jgi:hypothetical protein
MTPLRILAAAALMTGAWVVGAFAQATAPAAPASAAAGPPPGMGPGMGRGPGPGASGPGYGPGMGRGPGPGASGPGYGPGMGRGWRAGPNNTPGWSMMTPEERAAHQQRMQGMTSRTDCTTYMNQHHTQMAARAQQRGASAPAQPGRDMCTGLP